MKLNEYLSTHQLIMDGSMGTYYSNLINKQGAVSEFANLYSPEVIERIHREYILAGARVIRTNTFAANRAVLNISEEEQTELVKAACTIAKRIALESERQTGEKIWILGDIGPIPEDANTQEDEVYAQYRMLCDIFIEEALEGIHFETFSKLSYLDRLVSYVKEKKEDMFILTSFSVNKNGYTAAGIKANRLFEHIGQNEKIDACGLNCGIGSGHMYQMMKRMNLPGNKYIYSAPNAGYPEQLQSRMVFIDNAEYFADNMKKIAALGVDMIGGCCGTTPEYIQGLTKEIPVKEKKPFRRFAVEENLPVTVTTKNNAFLKLFEGEKKVIAVELDPPYDSDYDHIMECAHQVKALGADVITLADSPMGRSRVDSILMSVKIMNETGMKVMPHVCCRDRNMISMRSVLLGAYIHGIQNLLIVTGDPVPGENRLSTTGVFDYNSIQLMDYVKEMNTEHFSKQPICYGGALNYGRGKIENQLERMKRKMDAGAEFFLTQPIYAKEDMERIRYLKERIDVKILCGIMPLVSYRNACFIKNEITGINVPEEVVNRYHPQMSREEAELTGAALAREIMEMAEPVADGYYFMLPFNRISLLEKILRK